MSDKDWLTLREAMVVARVGYTTIRKYVKSGAVEANKPRGKVLIKKDSLDAFMNSGRIVPKVSA